MSIKLDKYFSTKDYKGSSLKPFNLKIGIIKKNKYKLNNYLSYKSCRLSWVQLQHKSLAPKLTPEPTRDQCEILETPDPFP